MCKIEKSAKIKIHPLVVVANNSGHEEQILQYIESMFSIKEKKYIRDGRKQKGGEEKNIK